MKTVRGLTYLMFAVSVALAAGGPNVAFAQDSASGSAPEKMDVETHTLVINKLEQALKEAKEDETVSLRPVRARLADLYAERARLRAMDEAERECQDCKGAIEDRKRALQLYAQVAKEAPQENRGALELQMAHLNEMNGQEKKSAELYEQIIKEGKKKHDKDVLATAYIGRAEVQFSKSNFDKAQKDFETALSMVGPNRRGQIMHRIAWCSLNKGEQVKATRSLVHILETPSLLVRESTTGTQFDASFQEDVARDLATFLAHGELTEREIKLLERLTPERARRDTLKHLAGECERLGQKHAAVTAWLAYARYETNPTDRLESMIRLAQVRYDMNDKAEAMSGVRSIAAFWVKNGCQPSQTDENKDRCDELHGRLRTLVTNWHRAEKKAPSSNLFEAYMAYLTAFDSDLEMNQWAADIAREQKRFAVAAVLYHKSSLLAKAQGKSQEILEAATVGEVEMAELSKSIDRRQAAYDHYLTVNPQGAIAAKVSYQRAHVAYERGLSKEASDRFHAFAASNSCHAAKEEIAKLCIQAADLDLDSLVLNKEHATVETRAAEYARMFPSRSTEYMKISRTSVLKQAEQQSDTTQALAKLRAADLTNASTEEKVRIYKTRLVLAEKARDLDETRRSGHGLYSVKDLSESDREYALSRLVWAAELSLDFKEAFALTQKMKMPKLSAEERLMRLALLAELSGHDSRTYEEQFLKISRNQEKRAVVRAKMIRSSGNPAREFAKHESELKRFPALYAPLALEIFARTGDAKFASRALKNRAVASHPAGRMMARQLFMKEFALTDRTLSRHRLVGTSDMMIQKTLAARMKLLGLVERAGNQAISGRDWTLQVLTLNVLSRENKRLYEDIMHLPMPKRLKAADRLTYARMVEAKAKTFSGKAQAIDQKLALLWNDSETLDSKIEDSRTVRPEIRPLFTVELRQLAQAAPSSQRREIETSLRGTQGLATADMVAQARNDAKSNPFSVATLEKLKALEQSRGRETMVAYLDARVSKLKESGGRQ